MVVIYVETCLTFWQLNKAYNFEKKKKKVLSIILSRQYELNRPENDLKSQSPLIYALVHRQIDGFSMKVIHSKRKCYLSCRMS